MVTLSILAANIESRRPRELRRLIRKHRPDAVVVEQAYNARLWLLAVAALLGYKVRQYRGAEAKGIAVLVRRDVRIERRTALRMTREWIGPKAGKKHPPRVYPALVLSKHDRPFRVLGIHLETHNNQDAQAESLAAVARYISRHPHSPLVAAGDWNREPHELEPLARDTASRVLPAGKVDHAIVRNVEHLETRRLPKPDYAHGWALYTLKA